MYATYYNIIIVVVCGESNAEYNNVNMIDITSIYRDMQIKNPNNCIFFKWPSKIE